MVISGVRMQSNAGWYIGSVEFEFGEAQPYDRNSMYYPNEELLKKEYPESISLEQCFQKAIVFRKYNMS